MGEEEETSYQSLPVLMSSQDATKTLHSWTLPAGGGGPENGQAASSSTVH